MEGRLVSSASTPPRTGVEASGHGSEAGVQTTNEMDAFGWKGIQYHFRTLKSEFLAYSKT